MKRWKIILIALLISMTLIAIKLYERPYIQAPASLLTAQPESVNGISFTFLLGEDTEGHDYFRRAAEHFSFSPDRKTDYLIDHCRSLDCVIHEINNRNVLNVKQINIVSHGNPHTGLRTTILENGHRATPKRIIQANLSSDMPRFEKGKINKETQINFYSCGIGQNALLTFGLNQLFKVENGDTAQIYCSPDFIVFRYGEQAPYPLLIHSKFYPYYYKRGYRPSPSIIAQDMRAQYPTETIDWQAAITDTNDEEDIFHHEFHIPIRYIRVYQSKEERPTIQSEEEKQNWLKEQPEIMSQLEEVNIPMDQFHWRVNRVIHTTPDGSKVPAIKAIGMATALVVLENSTDYLAN